MSVNHHVGSGEGHCVGSGKGHIIWSDKDQSEGHPGVRVKVRVSFFLQTFAIWDWTTESEVPLCTAELQEEYGTQV